MAQGLIHIYCGEGKGKTTAAIGLAVRAAGRGMKVLFTRFLKTEDSGELRILDQIPEIEVVHMERSFGFYRTLTEQEQVEVKAMYHTLWNRIERGMQRGQYRLLVMDELMAAYQYGIVDREAVVNFLKNKPKELEVVMTGRNPAQELMELADYISDIRKEKHPFDRNILAREGIEF
ncbi:MAG: cob(I)yrinic acid a,c-diamide adenosyltransferase [Hespellia sp.]|nr:cob(I)yrinic acid a,c-diamide adenosyltransferase [Hespellia sp.]